MVSIGFIIFALEEKVRNIRAMNLGDLIAANLERLVVEKHANPSALAKAAGMGHTGVRDIITRKTENPKYSTLVALAGELGVPVTEITGGPAAAGLSPDQRRMLHLMSQLTPQEQDFLLDAAAARAAKAHPAG